MDNAQKLQLIFHTLGDANRLRIIQFIAEKECTVSEIVQALSLSQPLVSHHLRTLRENRVLDTERRGPFIYYKLKDKRLLGALNLCLEIFKDLNKPANDEGPFRCGPEWRS